MPNCLQMILTCICQLKTVYLVVVIIKNVTFVVKWLNTVVMSTSKNSAVIAVQGCTSIRKRINHKPCRMLSSSMCKCEMVTAFHGMKQVHSVLFCNSLVILA